MKRKIVLLGLVILFILRFFADQHQAEAITTRLCVAFNRYQAPYHFVTESGQVAGLHIDMLAYIAKNAGYELEYFPMETGSDCLRALENGEIDIVLGVSQQFQNDAWTSTALSEETVCAVIPSGVDETGARPKVSVFQLGTITPTISSKLNTDYGISVGNQKEVVEQVLTGEADVMVGIKESLLYYLALQDQDDDYTIVNNYLGIVSFVARVQDNDYHLLRVLNREIASLRVSETYEKIRERWIYQDLGQKYLFWLKVTAAVLAGLVAAMVLYIISASYIRRALRRQVDKQTIELQRVNQETRQHLEQLERESDMRKRIIRYSHLGMVMFNEQYEVKLINDSALALIGQTECPTKDVRQLKVFGEIVRSCDGDLFSLEEAKQPEGTEIILLNVEGVERRYRYSIQQILKSGKVSGVLLAAEDITDEETKRHELFEEEKNKILNQVVAGVAHEIKNPLTAIKTFTEAAKEAGEDPAFMADFVRYVPSEVDRINRLVEGLIGYARPAKGVKERLDLSALLLECTFFAESVNQREQIQIQTDIEKNHSVFGSRDQIKQVIINIVLNGIESMREKLDRQRDISPLTLRISLVGEGRNSVIRIYDEGMGMTEREIERCMDPFFTTKKTGTGLGLTLSKQYVQENNGRLQITSQVGKYRDIRIVFRREYYEIKDTDN